MPPLGITTGLVERDVVGTVHHKPGTGEKTHKTEPSHQENGNFVSNFRHVLRFLQPGNLETYAPLATDVLYAPETMKMQKPNETSGNSVKTYACLKPTIVKSMWQAANNSIFHA